MIGHTYDLENVDSVISPALIFYRDLILENTRKAIRMAGGAERMWPHVKTHKSADVTRLMMAQGIARFKCATIAEAEMLADVGAPHILVAYPLVGPNIRRYLSLIALYPRSRFYAIGEAFEPLKPLSDAAAAMGMRVDALLDVNLGMNRTGVPVGDALGAYRACAGLPGVRLCGLHCYDGHHNDRDRAVRRERVEAALSEVDRLVEGIEASGLCCPIKVMAGTPSFPCHALRRDVFLSPGTCFLMDYGYLKSAPDLPFVPAAALMTRVVSHPAPGLFTLDLGCKAIAADPAGLRGVIVNLEAAEPVLHSEEHWVWRINPGCERMLPAIGSALYVIPTHICPCSALYPSALVAEGGKLVGEWPITARNRKLTV